MIHCSEYDVCRVRPRAGTDDSALQLTRAWDEAQREGKTPKEILEAVSVKFGIYDEPTIRRIVKEASGKKLPRRRSNKPKAPKGKKD